MSDIFRTEGADTSNALEDGANDQPLWLPTAHGKVGYSYSGQASSMYLAKAIKELQEKETQASHGGRRTAPPGMGPFAALMALGTMLATAGLFGTSLAQLLQQTPQSQPGSLEIEVTNLSSSVVVLYQTSTFANSKARVAKNLDPLGTGDSDTLLLNSPEPFQNSDGILLYFTVSQGGGGIQVNLLYQLGQWNQSTGDAWTVETTVDAQASNFQQSSALFASLFQASSSAYPSFSLCTSVVASKNGRIGLTFCDLPQM
ncbi:MAG TPA: hypothetical protein VFV38_42635 [Ktedonobacteraceae bacterium]|nr:hypothetical protein [Ktedonobacteraceae bacterium]